MDLREPLLQPAAAATLHPPGEPGPEVQGAGAQRRSAHPVSDRPLPGGPPQQPWGPSRDGASATAGFAPEEEDAYVHAEGPGGDAADLELQQSCFADGESQPSAAADLYADGGSDVLGHQGGGEEDGAVGAAAGREDEEGGAQRQRAGERKQRASAEWRRRNGAGAPPLDHQQTFACVQESDLYRM